MDPDTDHLHHRLARSFEWPLSVLMYLVLAAVPGLAAAFWPDLTGPLLLLGIAGYASVIWLTRSRPGRARVRLPAWPGVRQLDRGFGSSRAHEPGAPEEAQG